MSAQELLEYIRILKKRWWLFLIVCGTTLAAILISFRIAPPQYEVTVRFLVNAAPLANVSLFPGADRPTQNQQIADTQATFMEILKSPAVLRKTLETLKIGMRTDELSRRTSVDKPVQSEFVWVTVRGNEPQQAADLANTLVDTARQYYGQLLAGPSASARAVISTQVKDALHELQVAQQVLADFKTEHQVGDLPAEIESQRNIVSNLIVESSKAIAASESGQAAAYNELITQRQAELQRLTALSDEYEALQSNIKRAESNYGFLVDKETQAKLTENEVLGTGFIQVAEQAYPPNEPVSPFDIKIFALGIMLSLVVSILLAFGLEYAESRRPKRSHEEASSSPAPS